MCESTLELLLFHDLQFVEPQSRILSQAPQFHSSSELGLKESRVAAINIPAVTKFWASKKRIGDYQLDPR